MWANPLDSMIRSGRAVRWNLWFSLVYSYRVLILVEIAPVGETGMDRAYFPALVLFAADNINIASLHTRVANRVVEPVRHRPLIGQIRGKAGF